MKKLSLFLLLLFWLNNFYAQVTEGEKQLRTKGTTDSVSNWKTGGVVSIAFAQTALKNWSAGGENSVASNGLLSLFANYKSPTATWDNTLDLGYGLLKQGKEDKMRKTDDKIDLTSKYGSSAFKHWYYAAFINLKSQMTAGYNYPNDKDVISNFLAPAYILSAVGMDYKPNDKFNMFIAPLTSKITLVNNEALADSGAFGVEKAQFDNTGLLIKHGKKSRSEFGGYVRMLAKVDLMENVSLQSKLDLFSNYLDRPENIDINWETLIAMKINKYISATITTTLIYDNDIMINIDDNDDGVVDKKGPRTQFKEVLGIGFSYKF